MILKYFISADWTFRYILVALLILYQTIFIISYNFEVLGLPSSIESRFNKYYANIIKTQTIEH